MKIQKFALHLNLFLETEIKNWNRSAFFLILNISNLTH